MMVAQTPKKHVTVLRYLRASFLFTYSDLKVIVLPHTLVGVAQAWGPATTANPRPPFCDIIARAPLVLLWTWLNVLVFNLANQRSSVAEDRVNKPWRPIPAGLVTAEETRQALLIIIPVLLATELYIGGVIETLCILVGTWMYNDLDGGNKSILVRHVFNGVAFFTWSFASTMLAANSDYGIMGRGLTTGSSELVRLTPRATVWMILEGCIVVTTIHIMDIPDVEGDRNRERRTTPLVFGDNISRISLATFVVFWSIAGLWFWDTASRSVFPAFYLLGLGSYIAYRTLRQRGQKCDERTYQLWCLWLMGVYLLPLTLDL